VLWVGEIHEADDAMVPYENFPGKLEPTEEVNSTFFYYADTVADKLSSSYLPVLTGRALSHVKE